MARFTPVDIVPFKLKMWMERQAFAGAEVPGNFAAQLCRSGIRDAVLDTDEGNV